MNGIKRIIIAVMLLVLAACSEDGGAKMAGEVAGVNSGGSAGSGGAMGYAPGDIVGCDLTLYESDGSVYIDISHLSTTGLTPNVSATVDYDSYPPSYRYSTTANNQASYYMTFVTKSYSSLYKDYIYARFTLDLTLSFTSSSAGTYKGTRTNTSMVSTDISGRFTLK